MVALPTGLDDGRLSIDPVADAHPLSQRPRWWPELAVIAWLCWVYDAVSNLAPIRQHTAVGHAAGVQHLEVLLHLDPERALNHWLAVHSTLSLWASEYYDNAHFVVTLAVVGWLWWRHPLHYRPLRTALVLINVIGFVVFWLYPTAPPRMLPGARVTDVVAGTHALGAWHASALASHANELAAMPSLHLAWAGWCALAVWRVFRDRRAATLAWAYPLFTTVVVLATGNHFLADLVAGMATMVVAVLIADAGYRWWGHRAGARPRALACSGGPAGPG